MGIWGIYGHLARPLTFCGFVGIWGFMGCWGPFVASGGFHGCLARPLTSSGLVGFWGVIRAAGGLSLQRRDPGVHPLPVIYIRGGLLFLRHCWVSGAFIRGGHLFLRHLCGGLRSGIVWRRGGGIGGEELVVEESVVRESAVKESAVEESQQDCTLCCAAG